MQRRELLAITGVGAVSSVAGCLEALTIGDRQYDVGMSANAFTPADITITAGEAVVWKNDGSRAHTVTAYEQALPEGASFFATGGFEDEETARDAWHEDTGGNIDSGERFAHTFAIPGNYPYYCVPHERGGMVGNVLVEE